jgi:ankyrin repeat protein
MSTTRNGITKLMVAAAYGDSTALLWELAGGADVNVRDDFGHTALIYAAAAGQERAVRVLLKMGADADVKSQHGLTPERLAARRGHLRVAELLAAEVYEEDWNPRPPLLPRGNAGGWINVLELDRAFAAWRARAWAW